MSEVEVEALTAAITGVEGVVALHPSDPWRAARVDRDPAPAVRVRGEELKITVRIAVGETAGAEATAPASRPSLGAGQRLTTRTSPREWSSVS